MRPGWRSWEDDPASRLTWRLSAELRAEAEEDEQLAALEGLRRRRLADVAFELLSRGDLVTVACAGRTFAGTVTHAAGDLLCLRTPTAEVDVRLGAGVRLRVGPAGGGPGSARRPGASSFAARLSEHEGSGLSVELGSPGMDPIVGTVRAVALDHVVIADPGGTTYLPLGAVAYVARAR